ncbi:MAG: uroporphyrinogen decarboxylase [Deltaproteobacteria bacterium]|nr:MAG: uroporphyrinogen decarboxylase [Deltaproteobacteria bacterium]RLC19162.1 MAG: uroporphyrinogen decarboxylase [Deltaproteobacteria bacterium]
MKSIDRITSAIRFEKTDRVPVFSHIFGYASRINHVPLKDYLNSGELLAVCQLEARKRFGYDGVTAFADNSLEAEAIGSKISYRDDAYPHIDEYCLTNIHDWKYLSIPDPEKDGRMPVIIKACRILKDEVGTETAVVGTVQGPMTLAGQLLGLEKLIYCIVDHPKEFWNLLNFTTQVMIIFGKALINAGAQVIHVFDPSSSCSVINRTVFSEYILPHLKQAFNEYKDCEDPICWLNITGQTEPILDLFPATGADLFNIDYLVPISVAMEKLPHHCINGNIKPFSFVSGEEKMIQREAKELMMETQFRGGFILSPGCEIPLESKGCNIEAMVKAVKS